MTRKERARIRGSAEERKETDKGSNGRDQHMKRKRQNESRVERDQEVKKRCVHSEPPESSSPRLQRSSSHAWTLVPTLPDPVLSRDPSGLRCLTGPAVDHALSPLQTRLRLCTLRLLLPVPSGPSTASREGGCWQRVARWSTSSQHDVGVLPCGSAPGLHGLKWRHEERPEGQPDTRRQEIVRSLCGLVTTKCAEWTSTCQNRRGEQKSARCRESVEGLHHPPAHEGNNWKEGRSTRRPLYLITLSPSRSSR